MRSRADVCRESRALRIALTHLPKTCRPARTGGVFSLRMTFGEQYPEKPPRVRFTSEVFHPNVYSDGTLCMLSLIHI